MKRGEVWKVNLDPTIGAEINKIRPCIIVGRDAIAKLPLKIIVPLTDWKDYYAQAAWHIRVEPTAQNGLVKNSSADTYQVRSISEKRLVEQLGLVDNATMEKVKAGLALSLALV